MVPGERPSEFSQRRGHTAGELRDPVHRKLRTAKPVGMGPGNSTGVRRCRAVEEPGALANRRHSRLGAGDGGGLLEYDPRDAAVGTAAAARSIGGIFQTLLVPSNAS